MEKIGIQSYKLINKNCLEYSYKRLRDAGFGYVDFNIDWQDFDVFLDLAYLQEHKRVADECGITFNQVHAPRFTGFDPLCDIDKLTSQYERGILACNILGCKNYVVHPVHLCGRVWQEHGVELSLEEEWDFNLKYFLKLGAFGAKHGVLICIENLHARYNGRIVKGICSSADDIVKMIEQVNKSVGENCIAACFDIGHANALRQNISREVQTLGKHLKVLHLHDNDGCEDQHQLPYSFNFSPSGGCSTDWSSFLVALRKIGFDGVFSFEPTKVLVNTPSVLLSATLKYIYSIGAHFSKIVHFEDELKLISEKNIVLFGSGKMFDNYMKEYANSYPPDLVFDNNDRVWGTTKHGVMICNPKEIETLDMENTVFIITSGYFEEIKLQLESFGAKNIILFEEILRMNG